MRSTATPRTRMDQPCKRDDECANAAVVSGADDRYRAIVVRRARVDVDARVRYRSGVAAVGAVFAGIVVHASVELRLDVDLGRLSARQVLGQVGQTLRVEGLGHLHHRLLAVGLARSVFGETTGGDVAVVAYARRRHVDGNAGAVRAAVEVHTRVVQHHAGGGLVAGIDEGHAKVLADDGRSGGGADIRIRTQRGWV